MSELASPASIASGAIARSDCPSAVKKEWRLGVEPDALAALQAHPEWLEDRGIVVDLAFEEYCQRQERGEPLELDAFTDQFPVFRTSIRQLLMAHEFLQENPELLERMPTARWPEPGESVGDLKLHSVLGRGQFSQVYLATEESTGNRHVAVKLSTDGETEAMTQGPLQHEYIVPVLSAHHDSGTGLHVVRMPYLGRATLLDLLEAAHSRDGRVSRRASVILDAGRRVPAGDPVEPGIPDSRLQHGTYEDGIALLAGQMASALAFLHQRDVCHRDLKPSNVLLTPSGRALLMDFNLAGSNGQKPTRLGGTIPYMAPESLRTVNDDHAPPAGQKADVFALGVILYELLTGRHPFGVPAKAPAMPTFAALMLERQGAGFKALRELNPRVERGFARLVERCLAEKPETRPTAAEVEREARRYFAPLPRLWRSLIRRPLRAAVAALLIMATATVAAINLSEDTAARAAREYATGRQEMLNGRHASAVAHFKESNRMRPDGRTAACAAYSQAVLRNYAEAIDSSDEAIQRGFASAEVLNNRALARLQAGVSWSWRLPYEQRVAALARTLDAVQQDLAEAIRLSPNLQAARYNRALLALQRHLSSKPQQPVPDEAFDDIERAIQIGPTSAALQLDAARLYATALSKKPQLADRIVTLLRDGINIGLDPGIVARESLFQSLHGQAAFDGLQRQKVGLVQNAPTARIVDPVAPATN